MSKEIQKEVKAESWYDSPLSIVVFGASGDLSKKKTYPALFDLYIQQMLPKKTFIFGYARSKINSDEEFCNTLKPYLIPKLEAVHKGEECLTGFFKICKYFHGGYDDEENLAKMSEKISEIHEQHGDNCKEDGENRLFYFAIPPQTFLTVATSVAHSMRTKNGFNRVVVEKPFGHDLKSATELSDNLSKCFNESELYRIDHYLGKELVQNMIILRFGNAITEPIWNREHVKSVTITFKEDIGIERRGGYFEQAGIIRDIMQNHLLQVLALIAMEPPVRVKGEDHADFIRDEKVKLLKCVEPWKLENMVLGQYIQSEDGTKEGYRDDPTVDKNSNRETYCCVVMYIRNRRWDGVPFILKAGKALDERKAEVRLQLHHPPGSFDMFDRSVTLPNQELVIRLQPNEAIYLKTNLKKPGLYTNVIQSELDLTYSKALKGQTAELKSLSTEAYTRLILDVLRGKQSTFVRKDELLAAWQIVSPVLKEIEGDNGKMKVRKEMKHLIVPYPFGSRGPKEADELIKDAGYEYNPEYSLLWKQRKNKI